MGDGEWRTVSRHYDQFEDDRTGFRGAVAKATTEGRKRGYSNVQIKKERYGQHRTMYRVMVR